MLADGLEVVEHGDGGVIGIQVIVQFVLAIGSNGFQVRGA
jgi:hypothetical protein